MNTTATPSPPARRAGLLRRLPVLPVLFTVATSLSLGACFIVEVIQPATANAGTEIEVTISVGEDIADQNAHNPIVSVMVPEDWAFVSGTYTGDAGNGTLAVDEGWTDSTEAFRPADPGMKWIGMITSDAYAYPDASESTPVFGEATVRLQVGQTQGDFGLGYFLTDNAFSVADLHALWSEDAGDTLMAQAITVLPAVASEGGPESRRYELEAASPNPVRSVTTLGYRLAEGAEVSLAIYDAAGRRVAFFPQGYRAPGAYDVRFDARALPSGTYVYRLEADGAVVASRRLVRTK
jgi:hypothetical protein